MDDGMGFCGVLLFHRLATSRLQHSASCRCVLAGLVSHGSASEATYVGMRTLEFPSMVLDPSLGVSYHSNRSILAVDGGFRLVKQHDDRTRAGHYLSHELAAMEGGTLLSSLGRKLGIRSTGATQHDSDHNFFSHFLAIWIDRWCDGTCRMCV